MSIKRQILKGSTNGDHLQSGTVTAGNGPKLECWWFSAPRALDNFKCSECSCWHAFKVPEALIISHYLSLIKIIKCSSFQGHSDIMWHSVTYREPGSKVIIPSCSSWASSYMTRQDLPKGCKALWKIWNIWTDLIRFKLSYSDDFWWPYYTVCMFLMWGFNEWRMVSHWAQVRTAGTVSTGRSVTSVTSIKLPGWPHGTTVARCLFSLIQFGCAEPWKALARRCWLSVRSTSAHSFLQHVGMDQNPGT